VGSPLSLMVSALSSLSDRSVLLPARRPEDMVSAHALRGRGSHHGVRASYRVLHFLADYVNVSPWVAWPPYLWNTKAHVAAPNYGCSAPCKCLRGRRSGQVFDPGCRPCERDARLLWSRGVVLWLLSRSSRGQKALHIRGVSGDPLGPSCP
jgi:hypothetical protein